MKFYGHAEEAAARILAAFENPETLPKALAPIFIQPEEDGETFVYGFKSIPVFRYEDTQGEALPERDRESRFVDALPLVDVARAWNLSVGTYGGREGGALGWYRHGQSIALGVENLATWAHELVHAADYRLGHLVERGQHWRSETVAELGGCVLLHLLGRPGEADRGGCWQYIRAYAEREGKNPVSAAQSVLKRTCEAVALILEESAKMEAAPIAAAA